ncbi:MAG: hypothetical protein LUH15_12050 [Tannerellaceae bacterium]|nr:hypothetical protein [Tannerellaceae bacterium]
MINTTVYHNQFIHLDITGVKMGGEPSDPSDPEKPGGPGGFGPGYPGNPPGDPTDPNDPAPKVPINPFEPPVIDPSTRPNRDQDREIIRTNMTRKNPSMKPRPI